MSVIEETIFDNRFSHIPELNKLGANISEKNKTVNRTCYLLATEKYHFIGDINKLNYAVAGQLNIQ